MQGPNGKSVLHTTHLPPLIKTKVTKNICDVCVSTYDFEGISQDKNSQTQLYICLGVHFVDVLPPFLLTKAIKFSIRNLLIDVVPKKMKFFLSKLEK